MTTPPPRPDTPEALQTLFVEELGWDLASGAFTVPLIAPGVGGRGWPTREERERRTRLRHHRFHLRTIARKLDATVFVCTCSTRSELPAFAYRFAIHTRCREWSPSPVIVFRSPDGRSEIWQWAEGHEEGVYPFVHRVEDDGDWRTWFARLRSAAFSLEEELRGITIPEVAERLKAAFWMERRKLHHVRAAFDPERYRAFGEAVHRLALAADAHPRLDWGEERTLGHLAGEGRAWARARLFDSQIRYALEHARKIPVSRYEGGLEFDDLVAASLLGLHVAVEKFDPTADKRLRSYASFWMRRYADRESFEKSRVIDLPLYTFEGVNNGYRDYERVWDALAQCRQRVPTDAEVVGALGLGASEEFAFPLYSQRHEHWNDFDDDDLPPALVEQPRPTGYDPRLEAVWTDLKRMPPREARIIFLRYLYNGDTDSSRMTLEEIGEEMGITRERVRQMEIRALQRLRGKLPMVPSPQKRSNYLLSLEAETNHDR